MSDRTYIIALDPFDPDIDLVEVKQFIKNSTIFKSWWNHIPSVFLVSSEMNVKFITKELKSFTHHSSVLVMEVIPSNSEGWLPERAWSWIRKRSPSRADELLSRLK
jgi:hypothetical protein